jgi:hypothetical protein
MLQNIVFKSIVIVICHKEEIAGSIPSTTGQVGIYRKEMATGVSKYIENH